MPQIPYNNSNPNEGFQVNTCDINKVYVCPLNNSCKVIWNERIQSFKCQCHGCTWSLSGQLLKGPATTNLKCT